MRPLLERRRLSSPVTLFGLVVFGLASGCAGSAVGGGGGTKDMAMSTGDDAGVVTDDMSDGSGDMDGSHPAGPDMANGCATINSQPVRITTDLTTNTSWTCDKLYSLAGLIHVVNNATLSIAPGTIVVMGADASLIVTPGAKLNAVGTSDLPILFTSAQLAGARKAGDWGAVILVGNAPGNWGTDSSGNVISTGANADANGWPGPSNTVINFPIATGKSGDPNDSSGQLKYVRLEYGGYIRTPDGNVDHEMLALYGVGRGTTLEYLDMRQANFECLFSEGGMFYAKHLVCQWSGNGGFGFSRGNQSHAQFLFDQESPNKEAEGIGIKGPSPSNLLAPRTDPLIYNATVCGTNGGNPTFKDPWSLFLVRNPAGKVYNFIGTGFNAGMASVRGAGGGTSTELHSSIFFNNHDAALGDMGVSNIYDSLVAQDMPDPIGWFNTAGWKNSESDPQLDNCFDATHMGGKPAVSLTGNAAPPPDDGFFDPKAGYIGAFKDRTDQWATGKWVVWDSK